MKEQFTLSTLPSVVIDLTNVICRGKRAKVAKYRQIKALVMKGTTHAPKLAIDDN